MPEEPGDCELQGAIGQPADDILIRTETGDLLRRLHSKDDVVFDEAFTEVVIEHQHRVFRLAYAMLGSEQAAKDAAQLVFIRLHRSIRKYEGKARIGTYLYRITKNVCIDIINGKEGKRRLIEEGEDTLSTLTGNGVGPSDMAEQSQRDRMVREAIMELPDGFREAVELSCIAELSYSEIAEELNIAEGTAKSRVSRGLRRVRDILQSKGWA